jgi:predicted regulator of amino acid metabolism with ACT domain
MSVKCHNCEKPAMFMVGPEDQQIPLCLDCQLKLTNISATQSDRLEREINFITAQAESAVGLHGILPRYPERQVRVIQGGTVTLNNISISDSAIGVLNTGNLEMVDSAISVLKNDPATKEVSEALKQLTDSIAAANDLGSKEKNEAIEILSVVASEAAAPNDKRKVSVVNRLLAQFPTLIQTSAAVVDIWQAVGPSVISFFQ